MTKREANEQGVAHGIRRRRRLSEAEIREAEAARREAWAMWDAAQRRERGGS